MPLMRKDGDGNILLSDLAYSPEMPKENERLQMTRAWARALVVPEHFDAGGTSKVAGLNEIDLIITVDAADQVSGVLTVGDLMQFVGKDGVPSVDRDKFAIIRGRRPKLHWCEEGKHDTTEDPCSQHPPK